MMNTYPIFHILLLEPVPPGAPEAPKTEIQPVDQNPKYNVEEILDYGIQNGQIKYLIKPLDYPHSENTWVLEPRENLGSPEKLDKFYYQNLMAPRGGHL